MMIYLVGASITFVVLLGAFLKDRSTAKTDVLSWLTVFVGALLWFVTLPTVLSRRLLNRKRAISTITDRVTAG